MSHEDIVQALVYAVRKLELVEADVRKLVDSNEQLTSANARQATHVAAANGSIESLKRINAELVRERNEANNAAMALRIDLAEAMRQIEDMKRRRRR